MHILLNLYPWYLPRRNRELRTHLDLMGLGAIYSDMRFSLARSLPAAMLGNAAWLSHYALGRVGLGRRLLRESYLYHSSTVLNWLPRKFVRELRPDVLFGHEYLPFNISNRELPVVFETGVLTEEILRQYRPFYTAEQNSAHLSLNTRLKCRAISQATLVNIREPDGAGRFKEQFPGLAHKVRTVPPFLDYISALPHDNVLTKHLAQQKTKLLFVGNDARRKGLPAVVAALRKLPADTLTRLELTIVSQFLDGEVDTVGLPARIISGGKMTASEVFGRTGSTIKQGPLTVEEVLQHMADSHVFVMPTLADTFGFVYVEAMAMGCAVIGPNRAPQDWILGGGSAGSLVNPQSPDELARAIEALVLDRELRTNLASAAWRRYQDVFSAPVVGAQYRALFQEAIQLHRHADGKVPERELALQ
jgi:glycosyltransferase involved in cell wall biosynthesis